MRDLKFRGYIRALKKVCDITGLHYMGGSLSEVAIYDGGKFKWFSILDVDLMQYTGLKDKNGKEIFEGDILNHTGLDDRLRNFSENIFIEYGKHSYITRTEIGGAVTMIDQIKCRSCEIIGNIYENPDLL